MKNFDLKDLKTLEWNKEWLVPTICLGSVLLGILFFAFTAPVPEPPVDPQVVPVGKPRFAPGVVIYSDELPKPVENKKESALKRDRS